MAEEERRSDWKKYEESKIGQIVKNEYEQKTYLIRVETDAINFDNLITLVTKELDTSFINDLQLKYLYQVQFENILEWTSMGLIELAKIRLSKLWGELKIEKSVGGMEDILQHTTGLTGSVVAGLPTHKGLFSQIRLSLIHI